ncbi:hypothetical protein [Citrobacter koseri]|uniref:hypothetical protein n=1 Tax=Citrobacter koseri TaxID=545 RepID=UPI001F2C69CF|nr:hypothetical protein [Citrobacter koseri]
MSNINKQTVQAVADLKAGYTLGHADVELIQQMALDAVTLLDELEAAEKRIAELEAREVVLPQRYSMLHRVDFDEPYHTEMVYKQHQVLEALHDAGVKVAAAAGKGE